MSDKSEYRSSHRRRSSRSKSPRRQRNDRYKERRSRSPPSRGATFDDKEHRRDILNDRNKDRDTSQFRETSSFNTQQLTRVAGEIESNDLKGPNPPKEQPNFALSGKLAAEQNTINGVILKYSEPPEARKPTKKWRLHVFKGKEQIDILHVHSQSAYLTGRDRLVADIPTDHPSCSKQHAVLQFRAVSEKNDKGELRRVVKPYIIDLESTNGTFINSVRIEPARYVEVMVGDVVKFGSSSRDYVILHEDA